MKRKNKKPKKFSLKNYRPKIESTAFCTDDFPKQRGMKTLEFTATGYLRKH